MSEQPMVAPGYAEAAGQRQEEAAHRIAWAAVKRSYGKVGSQWIRRGRTG